ncbi:MAG: hypothetical protein ACYSWU_21325, partial [Planctomycetota bacterium]
MDNLRNVLAVFKKHHFWVLCGLAVAIVLGLWWWATHQVDEARAARTGEIEGAMGRLEQIRLNRNNNANQKVIDLADAQTAELKKVVFEAWEGLYNQQQDNNPLPELLSDEFKKRFEAFKQDWEVSIGGTYEREYMDFIGRHVPTLFEMVDVLRPAPVELDPANPDGPGLSRPPGGPGGAYPAWGGGAGPGMEYDGQVGGHYLGGGEGGQYGPRMIGVVDWPLADRERIRQRFVWTIRPSTLEVRLAQEDLWVYEALLKIIAETNGPVKNHFEAAIQRIQTLQIGSEAAPAAQAAAGGAFMGSAIGGGGSGAEYDGPTAYAGAPIAEAPTGEYGVAGGGHDAQVAMLINNRYVNDDLQPVGAGQPPPYAEFNLMPIRMMLVMNETKLTKLLVECGNSDMRVEVKTVRVGMDSGTMLNMGMPPQMGPGGPGGPGTSHDAGEGSYSSYSAGKYDGYQTQGPGAYRGPTGGPRATGPAQSGTLYVPVEILGTICIYNPPNEAELGTGAVAQTASGVPPSTPP